MFCMTLVQLVERAEMGNIALGPSIERMEPEATIGQMGRL